MPPRCALAALALLTWACAGPAVPDLVITNARVFTNDAARPWAEAVAVKGQRVVAVGGAAAVAASAGPATRVIDAGGRVLVPGFNDARVDLPLAPPSPDALSALDRQAIARGVTSLQVVAGGPMRGLVVAAQQAPRAARWRLIRSPMDGERPQDEEPFLPPQPGDRLVANGIAWTLGLVEPKRAGVEAGRLPMIVGWAYGAEDPLIVAVQGSASAWAAALHDAGLADVWRRKRPRIDQFAHQPLSDLPALARLGAVVTFVPPAVTADGPPKAASGALVDAGLTLALGTAGRMPLAEVLALALTDHVQVGGRALTRDEAVRAMTWGGAYAEKSERDKGWLGPGTLADLAVLSGDVFTAAPDRLASTTSVLTVVGGTIVYDPGVLTK